MTDDELGKEIAWAGGWQEFYQTKDKNPEMYDYWTERYNKLRREYAQRKAAVQGEQLVQSSDERTG